MAAPLRHPTLGQFAKTSPPGAAECTPPGMPNPGPPGGPSGIASLTFTPTPSQIQGMRDLTAVSTPPAMAGPCPVMPTTPYQDLSNQPFAGDQDPAGSPS
jgi:hypothetical protein